MRERNIVVAAVVGALMFRVMRDMGKGGVGEVRKNAASYVAIGAAAGVAGIAVEVFPPAGLTFAGLLFITVALASNRPAGGSFFDDLWSLIGLAPGQVAAGAAGGGVLGGIRPPVNPNQPPDSQPGGINRAPSPPVPPPHVF